MFKDRNFNLAVLFSGAWHLFWIFAITIVITPTVQPGNMYQEIDFLGPILEKTAFDLMAEEGKPQAETLYARSAVFVDKIYLKPQGPRRKVLKESAPDAVLDKFIFRLGDFVKDAKDVPLYFASEIRMREKETVKPGAVSLIEGPAKTREIIYSPAPPKIPLGLYGDMEKISVSIKFFIADNGVVYHAEPVLSSGFPEVDLQAIRFIKRWRFSPLRFGGEKEDVWGVIRVEIKSD